MKLAGSINQIERSEYNQAKTQTLLAFSKILKFDDFFAENNPEALSFSQLKLHSIILERLLLDQLSATTSSQWS